MPLTVRSPYDQHWNFGIQQQLKPKVVFEVDYVGNRGLFLPDTNNINFPNAGAGTIQTRRPYPRFGTIAYNTQDAASIYHSLQMKLEQRLSAGFWALISYTFSKSITKTATPAVGGNYGWERALTGFDVPHNFNISFGYDLPFGKGRRFLNTSAIADKVIGGWQLQGLPVSGAERPTLPPFRATQQTRASAAKDRIASRQGISTTLRLISTSTRLLSSLQLISPGAIGRQHTPAKIWSRIRFLQSSRSFPSPRSRSCSSGRKPSTFRTPPTSIHQTPNVDVAAGGKVNEYGEHATSNATGAQIEFLEKNATAVRQEHNMRRRRLPVRSSIATRQPDHRGPH